jgi:hypothetical protein
MVGLRACRRRVRGAEQSGGPARDPHTVLSDSNTHLGSAAAPFACLGPGTGIAELKRSRVWRHRPRASPGRGAPTASPVWDLVSLQWSDLDQLHRGGVRSATTVGLGPPAVDLSSGHCLAASKQAANELFGVLLEAPPLASPGRDVTDRDLGTPLLLPRCLERGLGSGLMPSRSRSSSI